MSEDGSSSGEEDGSDSKKPPAKVVFAPTRSRLLKDEKYRSATVFTRFRSNVSSPSKSSDVPYFGTEEEEYVEAEEEVTDDELYMWTESDLPDVFLLGTDDEDETAMLATEDPTDVLTDIREMEDDALIRPDLAFGDQQTLADEQEISDFTLLEPDHPQMRRFQEALKECHEAKNNELLLRIKEIGNLLKKQRAEKEEIAVHLNYLQIDLDRAKGFLVKQEEEFQMVKMRRLQEEEDLKKFRVKYDEKLFGMDCLRKKIENVQTELDNVNLKNLVVERENNRVKGNIIISKRCVSKSKQVISEVEELQQECDIWITRLDNKVEKLEEDIALLENNLEAQLLERKAINDDLREAEIELEAVQMEKKNLMQQWYCRLEDSQKSEETYNSITENYRHMKSDWKIQSGELEKMKRLLSAEHEKSEHHQVDLKKMSFRVKGVHKILASKQPEYVELKEKIAKFEKILKATNAALELTTTQRLKVQSKISRLSKIYDRHVVERNKLQKEIEEKNREMVILDTVSQKLHKQLSSLNQQMILMEKQVVTKENVVAKSFVRISKHIIVNSAVEKLLSKLIEKVHSKDKAMASSKEEAHRLDSLINHKNAQMAVLQNKIERLLALTGGRQVNPYELQLSYLNDQIERENMQINELRKVWLADQAELIHMMKERDAEEDKINKMKQEAVLMEAKKMRIEGEIESQERESLMIDRRRRKTEIEVFRMNILIFKEKGTRESSVNEQKFSINFFNAIIKDEQKHFVEMQDELNVLMKKKNQMVEELVEIEKQILLWEKKVHIAKEMKATFGNLSWADEISSMKNEVWKMELRQGVLRKETERLNQVLEQLAVKTVDLLSVDESSLKAKQKANLNRQINDLQDKVKEKRQELKRLDKELHRHTDDGHRLQDEIFQREVELLRMQNLMESMEDDIRLMRIAKIRNLKDIVLTQSVLKDFELAVVKTQNPYWTPSVMGFDRMKECEKFLKIIKEVEVHHPEASDDLKEIANCYKSKHLDFLKKYI